uniref:hypothetical protein n=1 Tax=Armatimonas sp. TaxID=1872638 RepID=UPI00375183D1
RYGFYGYIDSRSIVKHSMRTRSKLRGMYPSEIQKSDKREFKNYVVSYAAPGIGSNSTFTNYLDVQKQKAAGTYKNHYISIDKQFSITKNDFIKIPTLNKRISISIQNLSLTEILIKISDTYSLPIIIGNTAEKLFKIKIPNVSLKNLPLHQAMDELMALCPEAEWEYRRTGFIVVRRQIKWPESRKF